MPDQLRVLHRPGLGANEEDVREYRALIDERRDYALFRVQTAHANTDGKTRWHCPAARGGVGCPRVAGTVEAALETGRPTIDTTDVPLSRWCPSERDNFTTPVLTIPATPSMKYQQQEYYGSAAWEFSFNRRTYIEGVFGNLKNQATRSIRRGFTRFIGEPLVTLAITAEAVDYNLKELEDWHARATIANPHHPLATEYAKHPLHMRTKHVFGFKMLDEAESLGIVQRYLAQGPDLEVTAGLPVAA